MTAARGNWTTRIAALFSLAVSGALLVVLYRSLDVRLVAETLLRADPWWLGISVGMIVPITCLRALRFYWVAPPGALPGRAEAFRLTLVASALNVFLPAKSGDLVKSYFVATRSNTTAGVALSIAVYERLCDLFGLIACCLVLWLIGQPQVDGIPRAFWFVLGSVGAACFLLIASERVASLVQTIAHAAVPHEKLPEDPAAGRRLASAVANAGRTPTLDRVVLAVLWLTHLTQIWLFTRALSVPSRSRWPPAFQPWR